MNHALHQQNIYNSQQRWTSKEQTHHRYTHNQMDWWKKTINKHTKEMQRPIVRITNPSNYLWWTWIIARRNVDREKIDGLVDFMAYQPL